MVVKVLRLTLSDIKILTEGQQIKNAILQKYSSIEEFAEEVMLYPDSLKRYLRSKKCGSATFRIKLTQAMGMGYYQIVLSPEEQIHRYVLNVTDNINDYNDEDSLLVLETLKNMCVKENMIIESAMMFRNIGMHYFSRSLNDSAIEFIKLSIMTIADRNMNCLTIQYLLEIAMVYFYNLEYEKAKKSYEKAERLISDGVEVDQETLYYFYYRYGVLYNTIGRYERAKGMFEKALSLSLNCTQKGDATMNIGINYKKQGLYKNALEYYEKALITFENHRGKLSWVYNNMAETYRCIQQFEQALISINMAYDHVEANNFEKLFVYHQTYAQIVEQMGQYRKGIDKLFETLSKIGDGFVHRKYIVNGINNMIKIVKKHNDEAALKELEKILITLLKNTSAKNVEFIRELKACIGDIYIYSKGLDF